MYRITLELECKKCLHRFSYNMKAEDLATRIIVCSNGKCKQPSLLTIADTETLPGAYRVINSKVRNVLA